MLKIGRPSHNPLANVRLPQMSAVPGTQDLQFMLGKAQRNWRASVELPFKYADVNDLFILTVKCEMGSGDPCWMLYKDNGSDMIWSYVSSDIHLLRNLVHTECAASTGNTQLTEESCQPDCATNADAIAISDSRVIGMSGALTAEEAGGDALQVNQPLVREDAILEGDMARLQVATLLQSVAMEKMTGRLEFQRHGETGDMFFEEGSLKHASTMESSGDDAVLEMLTWQDGNFHFYEGESFLHQTVKKRLDSLLMEGVTLLDQWVFLLGMGICKQSYLTQKDATLTEEDFSLSLLDRAGGDLADLKAFYDRIDGQSTLEQLLGRQPMSKAGWVPLLYNLVSRDLVGAVTNLPGRRQSLPDPIAIDESVVDSITKLLSRSETGMVSYPALLYFLQQEHHRFRRGGLSYTIVVFEMCATDNRAPNGTKPLPIQSLREIGSRIRATKRELDVLGHFETLDFALLLPHTDIDGAATLVRRLERLISGDPLMNTIHAHQIIAYFGIAGVPEDCDDPGILLAAAREAKQLAKERKQPLVTFRDRAQFGK
jgi:hypothetical protein